MRKLTLKSNMSISSPALLNIACAAILLFAVGCGRGNSPSVQLVTLPSGKQIRVTSVNKVNFPQSDSALVMNYETDVSIDDKEALRKEVDEIWGLFQKDVEAADLKAGVIRATHMEGGGFLRKGKGYGFVFVRRDDGKWHSQEEAK